MIYLYWYLGAGAVTLVVMYVAHKWSSRSESGGIKDILDAMNPDRKKLSYRIINNYLVPVLAAVLVLFVWPIAIYMKIKDMLNRGSGVAFFVLGVVATALNHEVGNDAVKNGAVVVLVFDVLQKVGHGFGRLVGVNLDHDVPHVGGNFEFGGLLGMA